jgi:high affinity Mn2+ porin
MTPNLPPTDDAFAVHGQFTFVEQATSDFHSPYRGENSLSPRIGRETIDATLYLGARLWRDAELWANPEIDQGFGLDNTVGMAGFPSAEAYKVGRKKPYLRLPRLFVRQTVNLGGESTDTEPDANTFGGPQTENRLVFTLGKFSVVDVFDNNKYAHDPRGDFLNWATVDAGTFDYAADAWGYTVGAAAEWYQGRCAVRVGVFDLSNIPNSEHLEPGLHELQGVFELEHRHELAGLPGKLLLTVFDSRGRMALLDDAVRLGQATGQTPDVSLVRQLRERLGLSVNLEQALTSDLGAFLRAGGAAGNVEAYEFTDVDRTVSAGLSLQGTRWGRAHDTVGLAGVVNDISAARQRYLNAGGLGILVGDGQLPHPGSEQILETYYDVAVLPHAHLSVNYQLARNPAYNSDRGPVSIFAIRLHAQF